jgi:hypothetical protein
MTRRFWPAAIPIDRSDPMSIATPELQRAYDDVRRHSSALAEPLSAEDQGVQSMPDASPTKWHLAHTTWFFETIVLKPHLPGYRPFDERWARAMPARSGGC